MFTTLKTEKIEMTKKSIKFTRTRMGKPCLWEKLKVFSSMKRYSKIFDGDGNEKESIVNKNDTYLKPLVEGDLILKMFFDNIGNGISILRVTSIDKYSNNAEVEVVVRKPSDFDKLQLNTQAEGLNTTILNKLSIEIENILNNL